MAPQRYEAVSLDALQSTRSHPLTGCLQINPHDHEDDSPISLNSPHLNPSSPPPSFRSRASSPTTRRLLGQDPLSTETDRDHLQDTFDDGDESDVENDGDDRQRLMRADTGLSRQDAPPPDRSRSCDSSGARRRTQSHRIACFPAHAPVDRSHRWRLRKPVRKARARRTTGRETTRKSSSDLSTYLALIVSRHTNKPPQTQRPRIGKLQSSHRACLRMKSTSTAFLSAPYSLSSGMA